LRRITRNISSNRFYGKSSSINFVKVVMDIKTEHTGDTHLKPQTLRPEFWVVRPWERPSQIFVPQLFPEPDLMNALIEMFFTHINPLVYVFHSATFRRSVADGLHFHDAQFGAVVLAVCALGAKYSDDPECSSREPIRNTVLGGSGSGMSARSRRRFWSRPRCTKSSSSV
ncbi:hypothetical protein B0H10DRAFT_1797343, partial [Mycena sp. CBHHK59/15]